MTAPGTTLVMLPGEAAHAETLFATERDPSSERWTGRVLSPQEVTDATAVKDVRRGASMDSSTPCFAARAPAIAARLRTTRRRSRRRFSRPSKPAAATCGCCCRIAARRRASSGSPRICAGDIPT